MGAVTDFIWCKYSVHVPFYIELLNFKSYSALSLDFLAPSVVEGRSLCNHRRAYKFFIDSIASKCLFPAFPCDTYDDFLKGNCFPCDDSSYKDSRCGNMGYYAGYYHCFSFYFSFFFILLSFSANFLWLSYWFITGAPSARLRMIIE